MTRAIIAPALVALAWSAYADDDAAGRSKLAELVAFVESQPDTLCRPNLQTFSYKQDALVLT